MSNPKKVSISVPVPSGEGDPPEQQDQADEEVESVVADVAGGGEAPDVARQLGQERAGVDRAVDDERVDSLPEEAGERRERPDDESVVDLVHVVLVLEQAVQGREALSPGAGLGGPVIPA